MALPPEHAIRFVVQRTASLRYHLETDLGKRPLVLPNGKYFPDKFTGDAASVAQLMRRIQEHAGMTDVPIKTRILGGNDPEPRDTCGSAAPAAGKQDCKGDCGGKGCDDCDGSCHGHAKNAKVERAEAKHCGTGCGSGCGVPEVGLGDEPRLVDLGDSWRVQLHAAELMHPTVLTTTLARAVGYIFLVETRRQTHPALDNLDKTADLACTLLGLGSLLLSGSHIYSKGCGGPRIRRVTALGCGELALATVLFAEWQKLDLRPMLRELEVTQTSAVNEAREWLKERPTLLERFVAEPDCLARGQIPMAPNAKGFFSRLFGKRAEQRPTDDDPAAELAKLESMLSESGPPTRKVQRKGPVDPRADELRALVDEALAAPGSEIQ
jgi:hypothetical protein